MERKILSYALGLLLAATVGSAAFVWSDEPATVRKAPAPAAVKIEPKPLAADTLRGIEYLMNQQHADGGWGQGGGWRQSTAGGGRVEGEQVEDPSDVGNTSVAALVLIRAGNSPAKGKYSQQVAKAVRFICKHIEDADKESLYVTNTRDTQIQHKIGAYVDTFLAALVLSELKTQTPDTRDERLLAALDKVIGKIERHQQDDGTFAGNHGWASILSQGVCSKALNQAAQSGVKVSKQALAKDFRGAKSALAAKPAAEAVASSSAGKGGKKAVSGHYGGALLSESAAAGDAGVEIYSQSANVSRLQQLHNTNIEQQKKARAVLDSNTSSPQEKRIAKADMDEAREVAQAQVAAVENIIKRLDDKKFLAGFGNNGGEEFLSYMNISETLLAKGGSEWQAWDKSISQNLVRVQNQDGSWSGQHCITGRTFCSGTALLTLMADRAPVPNAADKAASPAGTPQPRSHGKASVTADESKIR